MQHTNKNIGTCRLCLQEKILCDSHIIPKHFFRERDNGSGMYQISTDEPFKKRIREGWTEKLFCLDCEKMLGRFDDYAAKFFKGYGTWTVCKFDDEILYRIDDYDYGLLKLFILSVLWRSAVATILVFSSVRLADAEREELRSMLISNDPKTKHDYGVTIFSIKPAIGNIHKVTLQPYRVEEGNIISYRLQLNGFICRIHIPGARDFDFFEPVKLSDIAPFWIKEVPFTDSRRKVLVETVHSQPKRLEEYKKQMAERAQYKVVDTP